MPKHPLKKVTKPKPKKKVRRRNRLAINPKTKESQMLELGELMPAGFRWF